MVIGLKLKLVTTFALFLDHRQSPLSEGFGFAKRKQIEIFFEAFIPSLNLDFWTEFFWNNPEDQSVQVVYEYLFA
jgi:hypothetical protein